MTVTSYPWQTHPLTSTAQWADMAQRLRMTGVIPAIDNQFNVYADSTGMQVKVQTGRALLRGIYCVNDAEYIAAISTANPSNPRIDSVILRVDWVGETISIAVLAGTPAPSPVAPTLTDNATYFEYKLADVLVAAAAVTIAPAAVTDGRVMSWAEAESSVGLILALS